MPRGSHFWGCLCLPKECVSWGGTGIVSVGPAGEGWNFHAYWEVSAQARSYSIKSAIWTVHFNSLFLLGRILASDQRGNRIFFSSKNVLAKSQAVSKWDSFSLYPSSAECPGPSSLQMELVLRQRRAEQQDLRACSHRECMLRVQACSDWSKYAFWRKNSYGLGGSAETCR